MATGNTLDESTVLTTYEKMLQILDDTGIPVSEGRALTSNLPFIVIEDLISPDIYMSDDIVAKKMSYQISIFESKPVPKKVIVQIKRDLAKLGIVCNGESGGFVGTSEYFHYYFNARYFAKVDEL